MSLNNNRISIGGIASAAGGFIVDKVSDIIAKATPTVYNVQDVAIVVGGKIINDMISIDVKFDSNNYAKVKGFKGEVGYNISESRSGAVTIVFQETSEDLFHLLRQFKFKNENKEWKDSDAWSLNQVSYSTPEGFPSITLSDSNDLSSNYKFTGCVIANKLNTSKKAEIGVLSIEIYFSDYEAHINEPYSWLEIAGAVGDFLFG